MEVEEIQPPQKKLKQATLAFFKPRSSDDSSSTKKSESQNRKRPSSTSSESPNKIAKLSQPLIDLTPSSDVPKSKSRDSSNAAFEVSTTSKVVSSSNENKSIAKCLLEKFKFTENDSEDNSVSVKAKDTSLPVPDDSLAEKGNEKYSNQSENLETDKENLCTGKNKAANTSTSKIISVPVENGNDDLDDCVIVEDESTLKDTDKTNNTEDNPSKEPNKSCVIEEECLKKDGEKNVVKSTDGDKKQDLVVQDIGSDDSSINSDDKEIDTVLQNMNTSKDEINEIDASLDLSKNEDSFNSSLVERADNTITSTPNKATESQSALATPKHSIAASPLASSSTKKKGPKIDMAKRAEKEAMRQKLKQEKEEQRLEKKRKLDEEKAEKERQRKEKLEANKKAKQELEEKKAKEKEEKDKLKEEEKKLKEEQRLQKQAELEAKQEEKKKKEEERKQKEEEKRLKDEEKLKEEEEKRKKEQKNKMAFQSFFKTKNSQKPTATPNKESGIFSPFHLKKDMSLAPAVRRALSEEHTNNLDDSLQSNEPKTTYLSQLKDKDYKPTRTGRILRKNKQAEVEVEIVHDSEAMKKMIHKVKILKFHTDHRPPYCGTWGKKTTLTPRNPFKKDGNVFDYEVDSDEEWEEEEPGESLSASDGEEDKEENDEEEEDDWMVPHGYLSDGEGCNDADDISPEKLKLQQIAKAKAWDEEQKRKFHALPILVIGCFFEHSPSSSMGGDVRLLYEFQGVVVDQKNTSIPTAISCALDMPLNEDSPSQGTTPSVKKWKKQSVPEEAMPDLIRLVHGNVCGIKRLIREFRVFWNKKSSPDSTSSQSQNGSFEEDVDDSAKGGAGVSEELDAIKTLETSLLSNSEDADTSIVLSSKDNDDSNSDSVALKSKQNNNAANGDTAVKTEDNDNATTNHTPLVVKPKEEGHGCSISKRQLDIKIMAIAVRDKRPNFRKKCWYVHDTVLSEYKMEDIQLPNSWEFLSSGPSVSPTPKTPVASLTVLKDNNKEESVMKTEQGETSTPPVKPGGKDQRSIMDFTISKEEMEELRQSKEASQLATKPPSNDNHLNLNPTPQKPPAPVCEETTVSTTPKDKKSGGQLSITAFATKSASKSKRSEPKGNNNNSTSIGDCCEKDQKTASPFDPKTLPSGSDDDVIMLDDEPTSDDILAQEDKCEMKKPELTTQERSKKDNTSKASVAVDKTKQQETSPLDPKALAPGPDDDVIMLDDEPTSDGILAQEDKSEMKKQELTTQEMLSKDNTNTSEASVAVDKTKQPESTSKQNEQTNVNIVTNYPTDVIMIEDSSDAS